MNLVGHQYYEICKGVRNLALLTTSDVEARETVEWLRSRDMACFVQPFGTRRANVFFGQRDCVEVARRLLKRRLNELSDEEDFMLGALLGYDCLQQCRRYLKRKTGDAASARPCTTAVTDATPTHTKVYA